MVRWPYCFSLDDLDVQGAIYLGLLEEPLLGAWNRVPGICLSHRPTGTRVVMTYNPTREANLQVAMRRLDRLLLRQGYAAPEQPPATTRTDRIARL